MQVTNNNNNNEYNNNNNNNNNYLAPYGTDGRLFATDISVKFQVT